MILGAGVSLHTSFRTLAVTMIAAIAVAGGLPVHAQTRPGQVLVQDCRAEAAAQGLAGPARQSFVKDCVKSKRAAARGALQQKRRNCQAEANAQGLRGPDRKAFVASCLHGT